ncbi:MAG: hypothetical protein AMXMBFR13_43380 [Phycisphaerae bacterium]
MDGAGPEGGGYFDENPQRTEVLGNLLQYQGHAFTQVAWTFRIAHNHKLLPAMRPPYPEAGLG